MTTSGSKPLNCRAQSLHSWEGIACDDIRLHVSQLQGTITAKLMKVLHVITSGSKPQPQSTITA